MNKEKFEKAEKISQEINAIDRHFSLIKYTREKERNYPPHFRIQGITSNTLIENEELNLKIELMVIEFFNKERLRLQKEFEEL
jgi:hypothetical protein